MQKGKCETYIFVSDAMRNFNDFINRVFVLEGNVTEAAGFV
jgi:hypothetical protein